MKNLEDEVAAFIALNACACQAQADWDNDHLWPTDGEAEERFVEEVKARRTETIQQLCEMPASTAD